MGTGLIDAAVAVLHLKSGETGSQRHQLVTQADSEHGLLTGRHYSTQVGDGFGAFQRIAGTLQCNRFFFIDLLDFH